MRFSKWLVLGFVVLVSAGPAARGDEKSHRKAAEELLLTMNVDRQLQSSIEQTIEIQAKANPQLAQLKDVMKKFFEKHMSWEGLKEDMISIYAGAFSEDELKEITAFYKTPTGKKMVAKMPELMSKGMQLGAQRVANSQSELLQMIQEEIKKRQNPNPQP
ncbi:MAG: DUF2059 domain-containing protein [Isosphaeraceae bacterium]